MGITKETCATCDNDVGAGMLLSYCEDTEPQECKRLRDRYESGSISIEGVYSAVRAINKNNPKRLEMLEYVRNLANGGEG
jgi:hypothetical protein